MTRTLLLFAALAALLATPARAADTSPHKTQLVRVAKDVKLEVLDWGGDGPPLIFLAGSGGTAHSFDAFALRFTVKHHVYAITRRGFGASSKPPPTDDNYNADRLGDDILAVMAALKLDKAFLAGHSFAGEELSSIGTRHPERAAGLIYLEAANGYAFDEPGTGKLIYLLGPQINRHLWDFAGDESQAKLAALKADLEQLQTTVHVMDELLQGPPILTPPSTGPAPVTPQTAVYQAMWTGVRSYRVIKAPALVFFALPQQCGNNCEKARLWDRLSAAQADAFQAANPSARVVRIANATHVIFRSNPDEVEREMNSFMDGLK